MTIANSQWGYQMLLTNKQWHNSLYVDDKLILREAATANIHTGNGISLLLEDKYLRDLSKAGMKLNHYRLKTVDSNLG